MTKLDTSKLKPVSIDGIEFDAMFAEEHGLEAEVPQFPTESGFSISDTTILKLDTLKMTLFVTETPVTFADRFGTGGDRIQETIDRLKQLFRSRKIVEVVTSEQIYADMSITSITFKRDDRNKYAREIEVEFQQQAVTTARTVQMPPSYGKSGKSGKNAGKASTSSWTPTATDFSWYNDLAKAEGVYQNVSSEDNAS